jgi:hypothetical protein
MRRDTHQGFSLPGFDPHDARGRAMHRIADPQLPCLQHDMLPAFPEVRCASGSRPANTSQAEEMRQLAPIWP